MGLSGNREYPLLGNSNEENDEPWDLVGSLFS